ncbi:uncharacterized protein E0L32_004949 [Thyridium curvatum]|uniref:non-specific serine/threonine protein kinase n=1 Tax=Thyridium curvatum TaxID=1093900 RepID=A0A507BE85_9PEZI|nr:uncharacterized protein E0L32_004949 [Thyridium curvatum]TPX14840.1 hypothetical protein E0L32_004949 [Thyridium curvatum]
MARQGSSSAPSLLPPRVFPSTGFDLIDRSEKIEEERLPFYNRDDYYPMRIGEVVNKHYQVVAKLGYGTSSTVWLCRDLRGGKYWVLKVHVNTLEHIQELEIYKHLSTVPEEHIGRGYIRDLKDSFDISGHHGKTHKVFIMTPLGMSLRSFQEMQKDHVFVPDLVKSALRQVLMGLNYLHASQVIHTDRFEKDLHSDNLLIAITDESIFSRVEEDEAQAPSARKQADNGAYIYVSRYMMGGAGALTIGDLGQARLGVSGLKGPAMPTPYRAPEVILNMEWGAAVDMWSVALVAWDLLETEGPFRIYSHDNQEQNDAQHLAAMTALLGPPPREFLLRSKDTAKYWDENGRFPSSCLTRLVLLLT